MQLKQSYSDHSAIWQRKRYLIVVALLITITLGLSTRRYPSFFSSWIVAHAGDTLWTIAAYLGLALLLPKTSPNRLFVTALLVSYSVEFSQLIDAALLNVARKHWLGKLFLGSGFLWLDLIRYTVGATIALLTDYWIQWLVKCRQGIRQREANDG